MKILNKLFIFLSFIFVFLNGIAFCGCSEEFMGKLRTLKWVAYAPTNFDPNAGDYPSEDSIRKDLKLLYQAGFNGIVTYGAYSTLGKIPRIAKETNFCGVIMGLWEPGNREEVICANMVTEFVDGYCVGNEGLNDRYSLEDLKEAISELKESTGKPVTTTEQVFDYAHQEVLGLGDWIFPNIHPFLCEVKNPKKAVQWIKGHYNVLKKHVDADRPIIFKEAGFPTSGSQRAGESNQKAFFISLKRAKIPFVYFEAFDQPWKTNLSVESHWGLFTSKRKPKKFISGRGASFR